MCGIAGLWSRHPVDRRDAEQLGQKLANAMSRRGPNAQRTVVEPKEGLIFSHARLSVIDLSESANQPFASADGRAMVIFNGEIYNFRALRQELRLLGSVFRTDSDTEVVLFACRQWGVAEAAKRFVGMFAFAFWDAQTRVLSLARDPMGIKPLFYGNVGSTFAFASTLAALAQHPDFSAEISTSGLSAYFVHAFVPSPQSIYEGIQKLPPGHVLTIGATGDSALSCYWDALRVAQSGLESPLVGSDVEIVDAFDALLRESVRGCLISDVPLGAFLSGGIDSSLIVALMRSESAVAPQTFTIGFEDNRFDESPFAEQVAQHLGCEHVHMQCTAADAQQLVPRLADSYDEPFADSSQIPTLLLSKLTRKQVTVALSGDGGDELFCGYDRYFWMERLQRLRGAKLSGLRMAQKLLGNVSHGAVNAVAGRLPFADSTLAAVDRWQHLARMAGRADDYGYLYRTNPMTVCNHSDVRLLRQELSEKSMLDDPMLRAAIPGLLPWMQFVDSQSYLPDDILQKVDRASMAYSLEARVPYLDHRIVEFAWAVPAHLKLRNGRGKILMRQLLSRHLPQALIERPKRGFSVPLANWLRGDLRDWAEAQVSAACEDSHLDRDGVRATWNNFLTGRAEHTLNTVWSLLVYSQWRAQSPRARVTAQSAHLE